MSEQFSSTEQGLIERLRRAPQPTLGAEAREAIHARLMDALDHPPAPSPRLHVPRPAIVVAVIIVIAALIGAGVLLMVSQQRQVSITPTSAATLTSIPPTASPTVTVTASPTPTVLATPTISTVTVLEGPVESIEGNIVTIYGFEVEIPANDPILSTIVVGDVIRVEGSSDGVIIVATTIVHVTVDATVNAPSGEVWQDDGSCAHPPPDWAPANGWRRRCEGQNKDKGKGHDDKDKKDDD